MAQSLSQSGGGDSSSLSSHVPADQAQKIFEAIQLDFAQSIQVVFYAMAGVMVVAGLIALVGLKAGKQEGAVEAPA